MNEAKGEKMQETETRPPEDTGSDRQRPMPDAACRALAEAEERRAAMTTPELPREVGGRGGADPARFGDWEVKGRAVDF